MIVADLSRADLDRCLHGAGLRVRVGPLVVNIRSTLPSVGQGIVTHYAAHAVESDDGFADFHVSVQRARPARAWHPAEVAFSFDGAEPFARLPGTDGFPLLAWGLQWCVSVHCHQYLLVRGTALERHGRALLLPGPDGVGKSTLAAGLALANGWRLLSDGVVLVDPDTGRVLPLPGPVGIDDDAIEAVRSLSPQTSFAVSEHLMPRGRVTYITSTGRGFEIEQSVLPAWVVFARYEAGGMAQMRPLDGALAFMSLAENTLNYNLHGRRGFTALATIIDACAGHQCTHGALSEAMTMFSALTVGPGFRRP